MENPGIGPMEQLASRAAAKLNSTDPHILDGLNLWPPSQLEMINDCLDTLSVDDLASELKVMRLPKGRLPLRTNRYPFDGCSMETIRKIIAAALAYPEKEGVLNTLVLEKMGLERVRPKNYYIIEAHFNITELNYDVFNKLVSLGFEPDNFVKLQPKCYRHNFTFAFSPSRKPRERFDYLRGIVAARSEAAAELVQGAEGISGFFESEIYPSSWIKHYKFRPPEDSALGSFPFDAGSFSIQQIPRTIEEVRPEGLRLDTRKLADIHVKIPTESRARDYPGAEDKSVLRLRERLMEIGFYEIISESGNAIYTGQFIDSKRAIEVFGSLDAYANQFGGFLDIVCEPCTAFWRKREKQVGLQVTEAFAEVSPILQFTA